MKQKLTSREKFTAEIKKVMKRIKPAREKIEKVLADSPTFQKLAHRSAPVRKRIANHVAGHLNQIRTVTDRLKKELERLKQQYKAEPKKVFKTTVNSARSVVQDSWKKRQRKHGASASKGNTDHSVKTDKEKRESAAG